MFIKKQFGDGDREIHLPDWRKVAHEEQANLYANDLQDQNDQSKTIGANEPAIRHDDGIIKIEEDGSVVLFANPDTGAVFDSSTNQAILFGEQLHVDMQTIHLHTNQNELLWNHKQIMEQTVPAIECNCNCDGCKKIAATFSNKVFLRTIPRKRKDAYDDQTIKDKLTQLGIHYQERG